jgi:radical SAM superfamily enzyme YgiQ (UPF0313 family)
MKIILFNSPGGSHYEGPMMGNPALKGQLKMKGFTDTLQRDLDLELFYECLDPTFRERVRGIIGKDFDPAQAEISRIKKLFVRFFGGLSLRMFDFLALRERKFIEKFRRATPIDRQFPEEGLIRYKKAINRILKLMAVYLFPHVSYPRFFSTREKQFFHRYLIGVGSTLHKACGHGTKALELFYERRVIPYLKEQDCDVVGISISFKRQLEPALLLADTIKRSGLKARIVLGGSFITTTVDSGWTDESYFRSADYLLIYEGEEAFPALLECIRSGRGIDDVPNLVRIRDGEVVRNQRATIKDMDSLATPDYGGLPLDDYLERPVRLPLMTCRGCYWGRCTYCSHHWTLGSGRLRIRSPEKLIEDIRTFQANYGARSLYFTDESVHPPTIKDFATRVVEAGLDLRWVAMLRFEDSVDFEFLKLMRDSGCHALLFGLESLSEHVQKIINKGIRLERAYRIMEDCRKLGIKVHVFIIVGIPGEREEDIRENIDFLLGHTELYETVQLAKFQLMVGSPMYRHPEKFGIRNVKAVSEGGRKAYSEVTFDTESGLDPSDADRYFRELTAHKVIFKKDLWEGYGFRIYREEACPS